jgi:hypothetical protein
MKNTAVETVLSIDEFTKYFEKNHLGKLYFPNGRYVYRGVEGVFFIDLADLYKLVSGWRINHNIVPLDDIVAVIAFGSAVRHPGFKEVVKNRWFRGPVTERVTIQPSDADFLVITGQDLTRDLVLETISSSDNYGTAYLMRGGIHLVNRGVSQLLNGVKADDTVSISALREGIPIFFDGRLDGVVTQAGVARTTPRKILWDENNDGFLFGKIV